MLLLLLLRVLLQQSPDVAVGSTSRLPGFSIMRRSATRDLLTSVLISTSLFAIPDNGIQKERPVQILYSASSGGDGSHSDSGENDCDYIHNLQTTTPPDDSLPEPRPVRHLQFSSVWFIYFTLI